MNAFIVFTDAGKKIGASIHASLSLLKKTTWVGVGGREGEVSYISTKYLFENMQYFYGRFHWNIIGNIFDKSKCYFYFLYIFFDVFYLSLGFFRNNLSVSIKDKNNKIYINSI